MFHRFAQHRASLPALSALSGFPHPPSLHHTLAPDLPGLRDYRRRLDELMRRWVLELRLEHLSDNLVYGNIAGVVSSKSFGALLQHFFNHQTHHRGQVSTLLFQSGVDIGITDLLAVIPSDESP